MKLIKKEMPKAIISFVIASAFVITNDGILRKKDYGNEKYSYYSEQYINAISGSDYDFDEDFVNIYRNGKYFINDDEYGIKEVYIVKLENEEYHLIKAGDNKRDIITGDSFNDKPVLICCFRDSDVFYKLYEMSQINSDKILLNDFIKNFIILWNGMKHEEVPELRADSIAKENYRRKFGK